MHYKICNVAFAFNILLSQVEAPGSQCDCLALQFGRALHGQQLDGESPLRARQQEALAEGKGVHREVEYPKGQTLRRKPEVKGEKSRDGQNPKPTNRNYMRRPYRGRRACGTTQSPMLSKSRAVDMAVT